MPVALLYALLAYRRFRLSTCRCQKSAVCYCPMISRMFICPSPGQMNMPASTNNTTSTAIAKLSVRAVPPWVGPAVFDFGAYILKRSTSHRMRQSGSPAIGERNSRDVRIVQAALYAAFFAYRIDAVAACGSLAARYTPMDVPNSWPNIKKSPNPIVPS